MGKSFKHDSDDYEMKPKYFHKSKKSKKEIVDFYNDDEKENFFPKSELEIYKKETKKSFYS